MKSLASRINSGVVTTHAEQPAHIILSWQNYCDRINEANPVKRDEKVVRCAISDGKHHKLSSRDLTKAVMKLLQQSPYVRWMREVQGDEKTSTYIKLTIQAAYQLERSMQQREAHQRQRQKSRQKAR